MLDYDYLSDEQKRMVDLAKEGNNVLVDACIGSGKTTAIQVLCNELKGKSILYLTYNTLLKADAQEKIKNKNVHVQNYNGFACGGLHRINISCSVAEQITFFNRYKPPLAKDYDVLVIDEYQDIREGHAEMLLYIRKMNPGLQIIMVGDMQQKIYDYTVLDAGVFADRFLGDYEKVQFTKCFRLQKEHAAMLGRVWQKTINGVNKKCVVKHVNLHDAIERLEKAELGEILVLGARTGKAMEILNTLEFTLPKKFNKNTVYASIRNRDANITPDGNSAIFTTFDSSKGLERKICVVCDFTKKYWDIRSVQADTKYEILRNIFCVAASRGKEEILFVEDRHTDFLTEKDLSQSFETRLTERPFLPSEMFDFKYAEDVDRCYAGLETKRIDLDDTSTIDIAVQDGYIDMSPCIGQFQEAVFFKNYDMDKQIEFVKSEHDNLSVKLKKGASLKKKILYCAALENNMLRYYYQTSEGFVDKDGEDCIKYRLKTLFDQKERVQEEYFIEFFYNKQGYMIKGISDVVKDGFVYELKFTEELKHEHYLQCAMYMIMSGIEKGFVWNTKNNELYLVTIPDRRRFMENVITCITKRNINGKEAKFVLPNIKVSPDRLVIHDRNLNTDYKEERTVLLSERENLDGGLKGISAKDFLSMNMANFNRV